MHPSAIESPTLKGLAGLSLALALFSLSASVASSGGGDGEPGYYDLSMVIEQDGEAIGRPRMLVPAGEPAEIRVASNDTGAGYRLTVVARPGQSNEGRPTVDVASELFIREQEGKWEPVAQPRVVVEPGRQASLSLGGNGGAPDLDMKLTAEPVSRQDYERIRQSMQAAYGE